MGRSCNESSRCVIADGWVARHRPTAIQASLQPGLNDRASVCFQRLLQLAILIAFLVATHLRADTFPDTPFNGMQIVYSITGATVTAAEDSFGFTTSRTLTGNLARSGTLTVSGTVGMGSGYYADAVVTLSAGGNTQSWTENIPTGWPGINQKSYSVSVPIPPGATSGSIRIDMTGYYNAGTRGLVVSGSFSLPEAIGSNFGGIHDNSNTVHDGGNGPGGCAETGLPNYWINTSSLNLAVQDAVCRYPGRGPQLAMTHSWNSNPSASGMFGKGWRFAYEWAITKTSSDATLRKGSGQELTYTGSTTTTPSVLTPPSGFYDKLTWMGTYWLMVAKDSKWTYRFDKAVISGQSSDTEYRLTSITDTNGNAVTLAYTSSNVIQKITDAVGRITTFSYDASNRVTRMDAPDGRYATYQYDGSGNLVQSVDLLGTATTYAYNSTGYMTTMSVGDKTATFTYMSVRNVMRVASVKDANGYTTTFSMSGSTVTKTDPLGKTTTYTGTSEGFTSGITDPLSNTVTVQYSDGNPVTITDALGKQTTKTYDARGNVTKITDARGYFTTYTYDANDNMTGMTNALGKTRTFTYDAKSNLTKIASPLNNQTTMEYDAYGQLTGITNPAGKKTAFSYTAHGNVATVTDPLGNQRKYEYDASGINRTAVTDQRGNKTRFSYDANNRLTVITNPDGTIRTYSYDCCVLTGVTDEKGNTTTFNRDKVLNLTKVTDAVGSLTELTYDANGNLIKVRDPLSRDTTNTYDNANRLVRRTDPLSGSINYSYDKNGNLTTLADERSKLTNFAYDVNDRLVTNTDPLNAVVQFVRDELGRVKQITNPQSGEILYRFDDDGRVTDKSFNSNIVASFNYDSNGNIISVIDASGSSAYTYSSRNESTGITWQGGASATFTYDQAGNIGGIQYPGGVSAIYQYDSRNRVQNVTWGGVTVAFEYDPAGNVVKETRSNGTVSEYFHDAANRVTEVNHKKGTTPFAQMQYVRDAVGDITQERRSLPVATVVTPKTSSITVNGANQIVTRGSDSYTYDANGNLTGVTGSQTFIAIYDSENRPTSINRNGVATTYTYDGTGNRIKAVTGNQIRNYHHDRYGRLLFETDGSGNIASYFLYSGGRLAAMKTAAGAVYFYHFDKTGNTVALTDGSGNVAAAYAYHPTGEISNSTGSVAHPFTYVGAFGVMDEGQGLYFMKARYYEARTGRFIQKDPIGFAGGQTNLYAYVGNNPVARIDPKGLREVGLISEISGEVKATYKGFSWTPLIGETLPVGTRITVGKNGTLSMIHINMNQEIHLKADSEATVLETRMATTNDCDMTAIERLPEHLEMEAASLQQIAGFDPQRLDFTWENARKWLSRNKFKWN